VSAPAPLVKPAPGRIVLVQREKAPQTVIQILRPVPAAEGVERAVRAAVDTVFGGTFTSRLNANLREDKGWTYGARSRVSQEGPQFLLNAGAAVVTEHTGDSLLEFKRSSRAWRPTASAPTSSPRPSSRTARA
jgi:predicted Zn-dependent peptidase